ncbi:hypothetical protein ANO14919_133180 [Xylariales sp. No.14919]|nr:hypothetical protein ANO14919_133180 [Xylariales sp. No.14919]
MPGIPLDLSVEFDPPRVSIGFRNEGEATKHLELITEKSFTKTMKLDPQIYGRFVSVPLPSKVVKIEASTTYDGFCLCTNEAGFTKQWEEALILWRFTPGGENNLYLKRHIEDEDLNALLLINEKRLHVGSESGVGRAKSPLPFSFGMMVKETKAAPRSNRYKVGWGAWLCFGG